MKAHSFADYEGLGDHISQILITPEEIEKRVWELGQEISSDYAKKTDYANSTDYAPNASCAVPDQHSLLLVGLLKGVVMFMADLMRAITIPVEVEFIAVSSRTAEAQSGNKGASVSLEEGLSRRIKGRHVIFVEDVIDKGLTLNHLLRNLREFEPASLEVCTMFEKPSYRLIDLPVKYKGFEIPSQFVVGYGLDYCEKFRNLPFVGLLNQEAMQPI